MPLTNHNPVFQENEWQWIWATYDDSTYNSVLSFIQQDDVVLEIGAGDLRLSRQIARIARKVVAIEISSEILSSTQATNSPLPNNLSVTCADARNYDFPPDTSLGVMLIRHCQNTREYMEKLQKIGCRWLVTNARWRMGIEKIDLFAPRMEFCDVPVGWFACWCGHVGFKPGPVQAIDENAMNYVIEVIDCPECKPEDPKNIRKDMKMEY